MKKRVALILALAMSVSTVITGCGGKTENNTNAESGTNTNSNSTNSDLDISGSVFDSFNATDYVKLPDYSDLKVDVEFDDSVTEAEMRDFVKTVCSYYPSINPAADTVKDGDFVDIDYEGKKDGVAFQGGTAEGYILEIGSGNFIDGFESGLIGVKAGETVDLNLTFPEQYQSAELAGADVVFTVKVNGICYDYDTLTDEYVKGQFEETMNISTVEEFLEQAKDSVSKNKENSKNAAVREACANKLTELSDVTVPDGLVDYRVEQYLMQFENFYLSSNGYTLEDYVKNNLNMTMDQFKESEKSTIEREIVQELALKAFGETEGITITEEAFDAYVAEVVNANSMESADALYAAYDTNLQSGRDYLWGRYYLIEVITKLKDYCTVNYITGSEE